MPPKTRGSKFLKASKENTISINTKNKQKSSNNITKTSRKALVDKTNSASDDNASILPSKVNRKVIASEQENVSVKQRPRRDRRLPTRYVESDLLQNLSNSKNTTIETEELSQPTRNKKIPIVVLSPLKTPIKSLDNSLIARRPKRICRLPSKFEDHLISPNKHVPVQPAHASTPKAPEKPTKTITNKSPNKKETAKIVPSSGKAISTKLKRTRIVREKSSDTSKNSSADTNNNAKRNQLPHKKSKNVINTSPKIDTNTTAASKSPNTKISNYFKTKTTNKISNTKTSERVINSNFSFRILEDKNKSLKRNSNHLDIYEFTYDPNEEPPPQKKKRKKPAKKQEPKPKNMIFKNNYDRNLAKALVALKDTVSKSAKSDAQIITTKGNEKRNGIKAVVSNEEAASSKVNVQPENNTVVPRDCNVDKSQAVENNYNSVRVEDIALDFEPESCVDDINYSPVNSPMRPTLQNVEQNSERPMRENNDPLNLQDDLSFFDDQPVASSSMNVSVRHPAASPWRVEFGSLPIKWQVNSYVKPNMTPAFDSSFINFNDVSKKHVYTNIGPDEGNISKDLPQIFEENTTKLKQTSIMSFIKEVVEKSAKKKRDKMTPNKANKVFEGSNYASVSNDVRVEKVQVPHDKNLRTNDSSKDDSTPSNQDISSDLSNEKGSNNTRNSLKKSNKQKNDNDITYFGFDDSENQNQENISPTKKINKRNLRALKPRSRTVLQEINRQAGPTRAVLPVAVKSKNIESSDIANKLFEQMKSATEPPVFPDKESIHSTETLHVTELQDDEESNNDNGQSVHLFEDIELVHHLKANRKSYGKTKKAVTFRQNSISDSDVAASAEQSASSDDDLHDLTFKVPAVEPKKATKKKKTKKQKLSKKEQQEVEAWAAGFNSMCEDIDEFDLVVE